ncbi:flagellar biosynthetic protein FliQ [Aestuariibacter sp. AA17]|uniref:Flagellar biosynthetic protein FliQ n=1 Tax=Fluctibacter corallii TaxID=2984329 RepID=A0ABT3A9G9_9ALTE|nr:flagellar biosynthetic protein FliQ [Aestuariibacter sp. AA17]MCV2885327.1 flagellar biosynthetic protein FliQ [Aestuariibacter sp. AA17]
MEPSNAIQLLSDLFWVAAKVAGPILITALIVGLLISIFQVVTQIQEMTLTFVPKLIIVVLVAGAMSPFLLGSIEQYMSQSITAIGSM